MKNPLCCFVSLANICLIFLVSFFVCNGQVSENELLNYEKLVEKRNNSTVNYTQSIINKYDDYIEKNPNDVKLHTQKCMFLNNCYNDEYEEYNPRWEEAKLCFTEAADKFGNELYFKIFNSLQLYGDTGQHYQEAVINEYELQNESIPEISRVYKKLAWNYYYSEEYFKVVTNIDKLAAINDTLDIPWLRLRTYVEMENTTEALGVVEQLYESDSLKNSTNELGKFALDLGDADLAIKIYKQLIVDTNAYFNKATIAETFVNKELYTEARKYLVMDTVDSYRPLEKLLALWDHDLKYSVKDTLKSTYGELMKYDWKVDLFGFKNYVMLFKRGAFSFGWYNITAIVFLLISIVILILLPYIIVLPIHYIGYFVVKRESTSLLMFNWTLKDFWIVLAVYLVGSFIADWLFYYDYNIGYYFLDSEILYGLSESEVSLELANVSIVFMLFLTFVGVYLIFKEKLIKIFGEPKLILENILYGVAYCFLLLFLTSIASKVFGFNTSTDATFLASNVDEIKSLIIYWGGPVTFLLVAFIVPVYEEIIFRGVILSSCERLIYYIPANIFQAVLFALAHDNLKMFVFYFAFGVTASFLRSKTKSFVAPISMHVLNNAIALAVIYSSTSTELLIN